jgi:hypothetical protein
MGTAVGYGRIQPAFEHYCTGDRIKIGSVNALTFGTIDFRQELNVLCLKMAAG